MSPVQRRCRVSETEPVGAYTRLRLEAPDVAAAARPGQFVALAVGGPTSALLLRRAVAIYRVAGDAVDIVIAPHGLGTRWLVERRTGDEIDVVGPLGRPFDDPPASGPVVVVAGGYGASALVGLVERMRAAARPVTAVLGAADSRRVFGVDDLQRLGVQVHVCTDDGSRGTRGLVTDVLRGPAAAALADAVAVYACGPMAMLAATTAVAADRGVPCWCSVEESMACGIGVCMTCVLPVVGDDGRTRMVRSCVVGPTFDGRAVRWGEVGTVPADCVGAPGGGH